MSMTPLQTPSYPPPLVTIGSPEYDSDDIDPQVHARDYHGWIWMDPDKYPWMVDKFLWI
jgi:hypothetical protein